MTSKNVKNLWLFLIFVGVAAVFWCILALNEDSQHEYDIKISIVNVPDSVTFLTDPPSISRVGVRDKGTVLARTALKSLEIEIDFRRFASDDRLSVSQSTLNSYYRTIFGKSASISALGLDSIVVPYTTAPPRMVPVVVDARVTPVLGKVLDGAPKPSVAKVAVYSYPAILDTISGIHTSDIVLKDISDSKTVNVPLRPMKNVKIVPSSINVSFNVVPLESRKTFVEITPVNVPADAELILFPAKVEVAYLAPMDKDEIPEKLFNVVADYRELNHSTTDKVRISLMGAPDYVVNASLGKDSVEYTLIRRD